jgi:hypothetical protein
VVWGRKRAREACASRALGPRQITGGPLTPAGIGPGSGTLLGRQRATEPYGLAPGPNELTLCPLRPASCPGERVHPQRLALHRSSRQHCLLSFSDQCGIHLLHHLNLSHSGGSGRYFVLPGPSAWPLAWHDLATKEQLAAPDSPGLPALERTSEARHPRWAAPAQVLSALHVLWRLGEEQVRVVRAWQHAASGYPGDRHRDADVLPGRRDSHAWSGRPDSLSSGRLDCSARHFRRSCPCDRRYLHGFRLEPRLVIQNGGGAGPMHWCHPLSSTRLRSLTRLTKRWPRMTKAADPISGPRPLRGSGRSI